MGRHSVGEGGGKAQSEASAKPENSASSLKHTRGLRRSQSHLGQKEGGKRQNLNASKRVPGNQKGSPYYLQLYLSNEQAPMRELLRLLTEYFPTLYSRSAMTSDTVSTYARQQSSGTQASQRKQPKSKQPRTESSVRPENSVHSLKNTRKWRRSKSNHANKGKQMKNKKVQAETKSSDIQPHAPADTSRLPMRSSASSRPTDEAIKDLSDLFEGLAEDDEEIPLARFISARWRGQTLEIMAEANDEDFRHKLQQRLTMALDLSEYEWVKSLIIQNQAFGWVLDDPIYPGSERSENNLSNFRLVRGDHERYKAVTENEESG